MTRPQLEPEPLGSAARTHARNTAVPDHTTRTRGPGPRKPAGYTWRSDTALRPQRPARRFLDRRREARDTAIAVARPRGAPESSDCYSGLSSFCGGRDVV